MNFGTELVELVIECDNDLQHSPASLLFLMQCNAEAEHWIDFTFVTYIVDGIHIECRYRNTNKCQYKSQNDCCIRPQLRSSAPHFTFIAAHGSAFKRFFVCLCSQIFVFIKPLTFIGLSEWISQATNLILKRLHCFTVFRWNRWICVVAGKGLQGSLAHSTTHTV